jgi:hypothetical protein
MKINKDDENYEGPEPRSYRKYTKKVYSMIFRLNKNYG